MVYLLALHSSALHTSTMKFRQDFIGPLFIDTALDEMHYRLKDATGLLLNGMYHMNRIKKGSARTLQGIVTTFDDYEKTLNPFPAVHRNNCSCNFHVRAAPSSHLCVTQRQYGLLIFCMFTFPSLQLLN